MSKNKVLHIITRLIIGGAQENTMLTAELLDKKKFDVEVLSGSQTGSEGSLIEEIKKRGIKLKIENYLVREINPIKDFIALIKLYKIIKKGNYKIVHTHSSKAGIAGRFAAWFAGVPVIIHTVHGWGHTPYQHPVIRNFYILLEKITQKMSNRLIAVSPKDIDKGLKQGIATKKKYIVIRSGIETDRFGKCKISKNEMKKKLNIPENSIVIGTVTRLSPQKAPLDFIKACSIIAKKNNNAFFVIVGDGNLRFDAEQMVKDLKIENRFIFTGLRRDVPELMTAFDIFVLSSLWEGLPRVLPQAMATGLPIVATSIDGSAEAVEDGLNGFLVPPKMPEEIAKKVIYLIDNPAIANKMGNNGKKLVDIFSAKKMVDDIEKLYLNELYKL